MEEIVIDLRPRITKDMPLEIKLEIAKIKIPTGRKYDGSSLSEEEIIENNKANKLKYYYANRDVIKKKNLLRRQFEKKLKKEGKTDEEIKSLWKIKRPEVFKEFQK